MMEIYLPICVQIARWSRLWRFIHEGERGTCTDIILDQDLDPTSELDPRVNKFLMDRSILKVHLPNGGFNMVKYGDATDVKVRNCIGTQGYGHRCRGSVHKQSRPYTTRCCVQSCSEIYIYIYVHT